jgi:hypothetical protein
MSQRVEFQRLVHFHVGGIPTVSIRPPLESLVRAWELPWQIVELGAFHPRGAIGDVQRPAHQARTRGPALGSVRIGKQRRSWVLHHVAVNLIPVLVGVQGVEGVHRFHLHPAHAIDGCIAAHDAKICASTRLPRECGLAPLGTFDIAGQGQHGEHDMVLRHHEVVDHGAERCAKPIAAQNPAISTRHAIVQEGIQRRRSRRISEPEHLARIGVDFGMGSGAAARLDPADRRQRRRIHLERI